MNQDQSQQFKADLRSTCTLPNCTAGAMQVMAELSAKSNFNSNQICTARVQRQAQLSFHPSRDSKPNQVPVRLAAVNAKHVHCSRVSGYR